LGVTGATSTSGIKDSATIAATNITASGTTTLNGALNLNGTLTTSGLIRITNTAPSTTTTTGALTIVGGVGIAENLNIGESLRVTKNITTDQNLTVAGSTILSGSVRFLNGTSIEGTSTFENYPPKMATLTASLPVFTDANQKLTIRAITGTSGSSVVLSDSPALTGTPTALTPTRGDNSTLIATTAFVTNAMTFSNVRTVSSGDTVAATDYTILCDASAGTFNLALPSPVGVSGKIYVIRKIDEVNPAFNYFVQLTGSTIYQSKTTQIDKINVNETLRIQSNGVNWYLID
ncbi:hypothetical protein CXF59_05250, partial [Flavobacterium sp. ALD4]|uniref:hypothetical protein n=1 Tax=Flavobacterium sp. ALD4 TaxID=2058314 RepID=UPI000CBDE290